MELTERQIKNFWKMVDRKGKDECWIWKGSGAGSMGYGRIKINGKSYQAHRISYLLVFGKMPDGNLDTCHSCDTPACINPYHVAECTHRRNMQEAVLRGRISTQKLTVYDVAAIRASKEKGKDLAVRFGVTAPTISKIRKRVTWNFDLELGDIILPLT